MSLLLGGRKEAINMIEVGSKELSENVIAEAIATAQKTVREVCEMIEELREKVGVEKEIPLVENDEQLEAKVTSQISDKLYELKQIEDKQQRKDAVEEFIFPIIEYLGDLSRQNQVWICTGSKMADFYRMKTGINHS